MKIVQDNSAMEIRLAQIVSALLRGENVRLTSFCGQARLVTTIKPIKRDDVLELDVSTTIAVPAEGEIAKEVAKNPTVSAELSNMADLLSKGIVNLLERAFSDRRSIH